jgi:tetratricopeptide (TPR) repeat protein
MKRFWILDFGFWIVLASVALLAQTDGAPNPKSKIQNPKWKTNSRAESARAMKQYAKRDFAGAAKSFHDADAIAPTPLRDFNLGTAEVASGGREEGVAHLARALRNPELRAAALFNRGNAELASNALDYAVRDFEDALRLVPNDPAAKRNLEIALTRKRQRDAKSSAGGENPQSGQQKAPTPRTAPGPGEPSERGEADVEGLLRSVQQQEQEELARMRQHMRGGHVGW